MNTLPHNNTVSTKRRVLLLRTDAIGDYVLFTSALQSLRELFKNDWIELVVSPSAYPLASRCPIVDNVWEVDSKLYECEPEYRSTINDRLNRAFDIAINTMYTRSAISDLIIARTHAPVRIGFHCLDQDADCDRRSREEILYTLLVQTDTKWKFEIERYKDLLDAVSGGSGGHALFPVLWTTDEDRRLARELIQGLFPDDRPFAILAPGAAFALKHWSPVSFARVADWLIEQYGLEVLIVGTSKESHLAQTIRSSMKHAARDLTGRLPLTTFAALMEFTTLFVGLDSAAFHLAWALSRPAVGIFGGGHPGRFIPPTSQASVVHFQLDCYACYWNCIYDEAKCLSSISVPMVISQIRSVLGTVFPEHRSTE
jgi:ADP-heptose:LPS heptosyltransferase